MSLQKFLNSALLTSVILMPLHSMAETLTITETMLPDTFNLDGTIEAVNSGTISAQTSGNILSINGDVGDSVENGEILIRIDNTQQKAAVAQSEAALAQAQALNDDAQTLLKRNARLVKQGTLSQGEYDRSVAQAKSSAANVEAAKAALRQARTQLSYTEVTAPYAGIIMERFVEVGEFVSPGTPLMSGYGTGAMRAVTDVPQRIAAKYTNTSQVSIQVKDSHTPATDVTLYPFADSSRHSVRLRATLAEDTSQTVVPGQWVKVQLQVGSRPAILVPEAAILRRGEMTAVFVTMNERSTLRQVRVGAQRQLPQQLPQQRQGETWYEILAGLNAGETIKANALDELGDRSANSSTSTDAKPDVK